jgi:hypothetical protein
MFNETIYNVIIAPYVQDKIFRKRSNFINWVWVGILFVLLITGYSVYDYIYSNNNFEWISTAISFGGMLYALFGLYMMFYNPLRKYHISLQSYFYLLFLDYFYFNTNKYPHGFKNKLQYFFIVQCCIDSIDKYIRVMETFLICGENTIARIKYMRELRNILYKMKGRDYFNKKTTDFRGVLDNFYSSIHIGLKAVLDFDETVEYFDDNNLGSKIKECGKMLELNENNVTHDNVTKEVQLSNRKHISVIIIFIFSIVLFICSFFITDQIWAKMAGVVTILIELLAVFGFSNKRNN